MTEDQLDGIIGEIVLETGFQGMVRLSSFFSFFSKADDR